jgi:hypothetical protein
MINNYFIQYIVTCLVGGRRPRVRVNRTSFRMGRDPPDMVCSVKFGFGCLSGHPAAMSGLATVTYAPVSCHLAGFVADPSLGDQAGVG